MRSIKKEEIKLNTVYVRYKRIFTSNNTNNLLSSKHRARLWACLLQTFCEKITY